MKKCLQCEKVFLSGGTKKIFCSRDCFNKKRKSIYKKLNFETNICSSHRGTVSELIVCCDFLNNGYDVFKAISPSSKIDLIVMKDNIKKTVEVKTGHFSAANKLYYPKPKHEFDILAVTSKGKKTIYLNKEMQEISI